jgi:hypothetical protein
MTATPQRATKKDAIAAVAAFHGKNAYAKDRRIASSPEMRAEHLAKGLAIRALPKEQQDRKALSYHLGQAHLYRFAIGHLGLAGMFFCIDGEGDSWDEAIADLHARRQRDHERYLAAKKS